MQLVNSSVGNIHPRCEVLANRLSCAAVDALVEECELSPKPGLVDARGPGVHRDMDLAMLRRSASALRETFREIAYYSLARNPSQGLREELGQLGREGERRMFRATDGVNTHRGAIWSLGLLVASAASMTESSWTPQSICARAAELACFHDPYVSTGERNGAIVCERYGVGGARGEAQGGFPSVLVGLRRLHVDRHFGECEQIARLNALLEIMSQLNDTCILHRGGEYGLTRTQEGAKRVLRQGGVGCVSGIKALQAFDNLLESLNLSPGGSADLLAAALMLDRITGVGREYAC